MTPKRFMVIAGEASGDTLAAELVEEIRAGLQRRFTYAPTVQPLDSDLAPRFFGAGGPRMADAGVELAFDLTRHSITGLPTPRDYLKFRSLLDQLVALAIEREPHVIVCVDFAMFNAKFANAIKRHVRARRHTFNNWNPNIVKYISPQVWASREGRVYDIARDFDLLLSIFPFEKKWYAERVPKLRVEYVGHPLMDRYQNLKRVGPNPDAAKNPLLVLLPGSRRSELERHFPVMLKALAKIKVAIPAISAVVILPNENLAKLARAKLGRDNSGVNLQIQTGGLAENLARAQAAIASTGTVTLECAYFGVPTVTLYKASWLTYQIALRLIKVKSLTMPNLLAETTVFPEFLQNLATPENISNATLELLRDPQKRAVVQTQLREVISTLGGPGASRRAAEHILSLPS